MRPGSVEVDGEHVRWLLADGRELWPHPEGTTKIVFLDFDGVLNHEEWYAQRPAKPARLEVMDERVARWCFDPKAAGRLNVLVDAGAKFVISSTWRLHSDLDELRRILVALGFRGEVIGVTPDLSNKSRSIHAAHVRRRGAEIQAWMDEHGTPSSFVILDDDDDMEHLIDRLVQTDFETGLQDEHITRALEKLAETYEPERGAHGR